MGSTTPDGDMLKDLVILGSGPHAEEMTWIVRRINRAEPTWRLLEGPPSGSADTALCHVAFVYDHPDVPEIDRSRWASLVDPSCFVSPGAEIGPGCVLFPNCFVGHQARLAERVFVLAGSQINHHCAIGARVTICSGVSTAGHVEVGPGAYLGQGCNIRQNVRVGEGCLVGMGAAVLNDVESNSVVAGNPARRLRHHNGPKDGP